MAAVTSNTPTRMPRQFTPRDARQQNVQQYSFQYQQQPYRPRPQIRAPVQVQNQPCHRCGKYCGFSFNCFAKNKNCNVCNKRCPIATACRDKHLY